MDGLVMRVVARYISAKEKIPVLNKPKDRIVYVLPETLKKQPTVYQKAPRDNEEHIDTKGKPRKPKKPRRPRRPHKPEIPRNLTPAPVRPPKKPVEPKPVPPLKPVKPVPQVKAPTPPEPRKWKVKKPNVKHYFASEAAERVALRYIEKHDAESSD